MVRTFHGALTGHGLVAAYVSGEIDETIGAPPPLRRGWFGWHVSPPLRPGERYRLEVEPPLWYDIAITGVAGPRVSFEEIP